MRHLYQRPFTDFTRRSERRKRGFTLVEVLTVIAIMVVLAGLLLPVLAAGKRQALESVDRSNLSQIGKAIMLYEQQHETALPPTLDQLLDSGLASREVLVSPLDYSPQGFRNDSNASAGNPISPHRISYLSVHDITNPSASDILSSRGAGLVVSLVVSDPKSGQILQAPHRRIGANETHTLEKEVQWGRRDRRKLADYR